MWVNPTCVSNTSVHSFLQTSTVLCRIPTEACIVHIFASSCSLLACTLLKSVPTVIGWLLLDCFNILLYTPAESSRISFCHSKENTYCGSFLKRESLLSNLDLSNSLWEIFTSRELGKAHYIEVLLSIVNGIFSDTQQFVLFNVRFSRQLVKISDRESLKARYIMLIRFV